jgi:hypothetical protein
VIAALSSGDVVGYEKLRDDALNGTLAQGSAALGVLLHRGLAAWLSAAPLSSQPRSSPATPNRAPLRLPAAVASIILRLTKEATYA